MSRSTRIASEFVSFNLAQALGRMTHEVCSDFSLQPESVTPKRPQPAAMI